MEIILQRDAGAASLQVLIGAALTGLVVLAQGVCVCVCVCVSVCLTGPPWSFLPRGGQLPLRCCAVIGDNQSSLAAQVVCIINDLVKL